MKIAAKADAARAAASGDLFGILKGSNKDQFVDLTANNHKLNKRYLTSEITLTGKLHVTAFHRQEYVMRANIVYSL